MMRPSTRINLLAVLSATVLLAAPAGSRAEFATGVGNLSAPFGGGEQESALWFDRAKRLGVGVLRVEVGWAQLAPVRPVDPANPASYDLSALRTHVQRARANGLDVMFTIWQTPGWAEGPGRPNWAPPGSWRPDPVAFGQFASALTKAFDGLHGPRVRYYEAWNEPNLSLFLTPQWKDGRTIISALHYRKLLNAFYRAAKLANPTNVVIAAGVAPSGEDVGTGLDPINGRRTRPLEFYRELMCLKRNRNKPRPCPVRPQFDIAGVHPINRTGAPGDLPHDPDNIGPANVSSLTDALRAAERSGRVLPRGVRRKLWATEIWIETNPPDAANGVSLKKAGRWMAETLHLLWRAQVRTVINYVIRDQPQGPDGAGGEAFLIHGGFWYDPSVRRGEIKRPLFNAFRFPLVAKRIGRGRVKIWGRAPRGGRMQIWRRVPGGWEPVKGVRVQPWQIFSERARLPAGKQRLWARVGGEGSGVWAVGP